MVAPTAQLGFAEQVYLEAGKALVAGKRAGTVVQELAMMGIPHPVAQDIVAKAGQAKRAAFRKAGLKAFLAGIGLIVLGIVITSITYSLASPGGLYIVAIGPFIAGVVNVFRGLFRMITG